MAKRKRTEHLPTVTNMDFPVMIPNEKGETTVHVATARLRFGTLVLEFKDTAPAVAIQRMIERGVLLGLGMVMLKPDEVNLGYQEVVENEKLEQEVNELFQKEDAAALEELEEARPDDVDR
jgi:hypothetical protein